MGKEYEILGQDLICPSPSEAAVMPSPPGFSLHLRGRRLRGPTAGA